MMVVLLAEIFASWIRDSLGGVYLAAMNERSNGLL